MIMVMITTKVLKMIIDTTTSATTERAPMLKGIENPEKEELRC